MSDTTYNGWKNHATWVVNLHFGDSEDMIAEFVKEARGDADKVATSYESWVSDYVEEVIGDNTFVNDLLTLSDVDWDELAAHAVHEYWTEEEEEEDSEEEEEEPTEEEIAAVVEAAKARIAARAAQDESEYHKETYPAPADDIDAKLDDIAGRIADLRNDIESE